MKLSIDQIIKMSKYDDTYVGIGVRIDAKEFVEKFGKRDLLEICMELFKKIFSDEKEQKTGILNILHTHYFGEEVYFIGHISATNYNEVIVFDPSELNRVSFLIKLGFVPTDFVFIIAREELEYVWVDKDVCEDQENVEKESEVLF